MEFEFSVQCRQTTIATLSRCQMSGGPSNVSVKESLHKVPSRGKYRRLGLQRSDSMWSSGGAWSTNKRPPLQCGGSARWSSSFQVALETAPNRHRIVGSSSSVSELKPSIEMKDRDRWSSSSRAAFDTAPQAPTRHRIMGSSSVSALEPSIEMKDRDTFEIGLMALCIFNNMSEKPPASLKTAVRCMPPILTAPAPIVSKSR
jgi:hypothetical protein